MIYRPFTAADRDACLAIFDSNLERYFAAGERADFAGFLAAPPGFFGVLCDDDGTVVGCGGIGVRDEGRTAVLTWGMIVAQRASPGTGQNAHAGPSREVGRVSFGGEGAHEHQSRVAWVLSQDGLSAGAPHS